jgi:histidinol-phosphate/aromatic aminotransferase/cobyric acid decarboxylase-like protein
MTAALEAIGLQVTPSVGNFVLVGFAAAKAGRLPRPMRF